MSVDNVVIHPAAVQQLRRATAYGVLNFVFALEAQGKRNCPVRGGYRSFDPGGPVGGTLRRSIHGVVYVDGQRLGGDSADENGKPVPGYPTEGAEIVGVVGTNSGYGEWVHDGTTRMAARPFLHEALMETRDHAPALIEAGAKKHLGG